MNISSSYANIVTIAPSVSVSTEQMTRENKLREKIAPTKESDPSAKNKAVADQQSEPTSVNQKPEQNRDYNDHAHQEADYLDKQQASSDYNQYQFTPASYGYSAVKSNNHMPISRDYDLAIPTKTGALQIPDEALERLKELREADQKRGVVAMRYEQTGAGNLPSEVLIVI